MTDLQQRYLETRQLLWTNFHADVHRQMLDDETEVTNVFELQILKNQLALIKVQLTELEIGEVDSVFEPWLNG